MIKKLMVIMLIVLFGTASVLGTETKVFPVPNLLKPEGLMLDKTRMYVIEGTSIYIYSLKDFKLIKKFGKKGEGPQEFIVNPQFSPLVIYVHTEDIVVNSFGKLSWFSKDGTFKKELKTPSPFIFPLQPFGKNFIGLRLALGQERWQILSLYDDKINELKEITRQKHPFQPGKGTYILETVPTTTVHEDKVFMAWEKDFIIKVLGPDLKELYTIKRSEKKRSVTDEDKKEIIDFLKTYPQTKDVIEILKPFHFPDYFPAIAGLVVTGNKIYVLTFKEDEAENDECLIMDLKGKLLKRAFLPLKMSTPILPYPYNIQEGTVYQVVEDEEEEEWAIHVTKIK